MAQKTLYRLGRLRSWWDAAVTSFWLVPGLMILLAGGLALAAQGLDDWLVEADGVWWIYTAHEDEARGLLSTLLSSMINMTSLVFSVTIVVLTLAASQFGPRLIRNFMASPQTQFVLGTFVMTIVYCLLVLPMIGGRADPRPLPFPTVSIALILVVVSVVLLISFIHGLARSIVSETVIERVGRELDKTIGELDPFQSMPASPSGSLPDGFEDNAARFGPTTSGYVQAVAFEHLVKVAEARDAVIALYFQPGDYVAEDGDGIAVFPKERCTGELQREISAAISVGAHRTPVQDIEFSIRHLVEIAVRALSPGTNDPYTAVAVVHRLSASMSRILGRALPDHVFRDDRGSVRAVCPMPSYAGLLNGAFDQIRQNGADKPFVVIHLLEALIRIAPHARAPAQLDALFELAEQMMADAKSAIGSAADLEAIRKRYDKTTHALKEARRTFLAPHRSAPSR